MPVYRHTRKKKKPKPLVVFAAILNLDVRFSWSVSRFICFRQFHSSLFSNLNPIHIIFSTYQDEEGNTVLHCTEDHQFDDPLVIRELIQNKADPNILNNAGETPLHAACVYLPLKFVRELKGADPNVANNKGYMPIHVACKYYNPAVIEWLIKEAGTCLDISTDTVAKASPLELAIRHELYEEDGDNPLPFLLDLGMDPSKGGLSANGGTVLHALLADDTLIHEELTGFLETLLARQPLLIYARDNQQVTLLHLVAKGWPKDLMSKLVETYNADLMANDVRGWTPLTWAIVHGNNDGVSMLLDLYKKNELEVDVPDNNGWTTLHWAVFHSKSDCIRLLLEHGAKANIVNNKQRLALHMAGYPFSEADAKKSRFHYGDWDVSRVMKNSICLAYDPSFELDVHWVDELLMQTHNVSALDEDGNLPFFLSASGKNVTLTFSTLRASAEKGLFDAIGRCKSSSV